jgi:hypothetical protein
MSEEAHPVGDAERRHAAEIARAHAAIAAAQDRSYWLDRWHVDLNTLMRRRGAGELRAAVRVLRAVYRALHSASDKARVSARPLPSRAGRARQVVRGERSRADSVGRRAVSSSSARTQPGPVTERLAGGVDGDDPQLLVAVQRADLMVDALARAGGEPAAGQEWLGIGPGADAVLTVLRDAYPELECRFDATNGPVDVAFAISNWGAAQPLARVKELRRSVRSGGRLLLSVDPGADAEQVTAEQVLAHCTPDWRVALYLPGGMEGGRDLYVLERT